MEIHLNEIAVCPKETAKELEEREEENRLLRLQLNEKASELYEAMLLLRTAQRCGKPFNELGKRQQQRIKKEILDKAAAALRFAELYGLVPKSLELEDSTSGSTVELNLSKEKEKSSYEASDEEGRLKIQTILYIVDQFSISLEGYHELTQANPSLPRTYKVEQCAKYLDSEWEVKRTPGECPGAELPFRVLLEKEIKRHLQTGVDPVQKYKIKLSGDGARMSHTSNLFVFSFALLDIEGQNVLSSAANHTVALVVGNEDYDTLKESLANVINDVNNLIDIGKMTVDSKEFDLEFFLGGDYKFLLNAMGMKAATSDHSCIWCNLHKKDRCDMSHRCTYFNTAPIARVVDENWHKQPGCHSPPLFKINLDHIIIDELHLMLRVTDRQIGRGANQRHN